MLMNAEVTTFLAGNKALKIHSHDRMESKKMNNNDSR